MEEGDVKRPRVILGLAIHLTGPLQVSFGQPNGLPGAT